MSKDDIITGRFLKEHRTKKVWEIEKIANGFVRLVDVNDKVHKRSTNIANVIFDYEIYIAEVAINESFKEYFLLNQ